MIDHGIRGKGIGASEIACVLGMHPSRSAFDLWAEKTGAIQRPEPNQRMRRGKYFERGVVEWYADITGNQTEWFDNTIANEIRPWQVVTPDAWLIKDAARDGLIEAKTASWTEADKWGDSGSDLMPDHYAIQVQWALSATGKSYGDVAALIGMDDLRIYRVNRDPEIEAVLLEEAERFWKKHVIGGEAPQISATTGAAEYLKQRFPRAVGEIREADFSEHALVVDWRKAAEDLAAAKKREEELGNQLKDLIGHDAGMKLEDGDCVTWREQTRKGYTVQDCTFRVLRYRKARTGKGK